MSILYSGGVLGKFLVSGVEDVSGNYSGTFSFGPGVGTYAGSLTCMQRSRCISEMID